MILYCASAQGNLFRYKLQISEVMNMRLSNSTNILNFDFKKPYMVSPENSIAVLAAAGFKHIE